LILCKGRKQKQSKLYQCQYCEQGFSSKSNLNRHLSRSNCKLEHQIGSGNVDNNPSPSASNDSISSNNSSNNSNVPTKRYTCRQCGSIFDNRSQLKMHKNISHMSVEGLLPIPWGENPNDAPWFSEDGDDIPFRDLYEAKSAFIRCPHDIGKNRRIYNFVTNDLQEGKKEIIDALSAIYQKQTNSFKIALCFGFIMKNIETDELSYFAPYINFNVLGEELDLIHNRDQFDKMIESFNEDDIIYQARNQRPSSQIKPYFCVQFSVFIFPIINKLLGTGRVDDFILKNRYIKALVRSRGGNKYADNLCIFRCLAYFLGERSIEQFIKLSYQKWRLYMLRENNKKLSPHSKKFPGIQIPELFYFEKCFQVNVNVFSLNSDKTAHLIYRSTRNESVSGKYMMLNLNKNHLSYITNFSGYAKKYSCPFCSKLFSSHQQVYKHLEKCSNGCKYIYPSGYYKHQKSIFDELEEIGIFTKSHCDNFFAVFDYEVVLAPSNCNPSDKVVWTHRHIPISVSLASNVDGFLDPHTIINADLDIILKEMIHYLEQIRLKVVEKARIKWRDVFMQLDALMSLYHGDMQRVRSLSTTSKDSINQSHKNKPNTKRKGKKEERKRRIKTGSELMKSHLENIYAKWLQYISQLVVLGFNNSKYDNVLIISRLAYYLNLHASKKSFIVKKNNAYACIASDKFRILDICNYLAAGTSYSQFLKAFQIEEKKSYFPYEYLSSFEKLNETSLPPYDSFYSSLKQANLLNIEYEQWEKTASTELPPMGGMENYNQLLDVWQARGMQTMRDFLQYYNEKDVYPLVQAINKYKKLYEDQNIDIFKSAISLAGLGRQLLFKSARESSNTNFILLGKKNLDLIKTIKANIVGGPSIIFTRKHEVDTTFIRNNKNKLCKSIIGIDYNALYNFTYRFETGCSSFIRRNAPDFIGRLDTKFTDQYLWMNYLMITNNIFIQHYENSGKEVRIGSYRVDGLDIINKTVYEVSIFF
jgi:hypothetical protein